ELARIYYICLSLGFKGRHIDNPEELARIRSRLYRQFQGGLTEKSGKLTHDAYHVTPESGKPLQPLINLIRVGVAVVIVLTLSFIAYFGMSAFYIETIQDKANKIELYSGGGIDSDR
ncbi:DotU family type IV/VI secretion system protein, partial [Thermodesulfobacteriota bacterium]